MIRHFLKTALRIFYKQKMYSLISLSGLILAFTVSFLILIYAINELSINREFIHSARIYRVINHVRSTSSTWAVTIKDLGPQIKASIPELEGVSRMLGSRNVVKIIEIDKEVGTRAVFVDNDFFKMFENKYGINSNLQFPDLYSVVITKKLASKISTDSTLSNQTIELLVNGKQAFVKIIKVIDGFTERSNIQGDIFLSMDLWDKTNDATILDWHPFFHTFIMTAPNADLDGIQVSFDAMDNDHFDGTKTSNYILQPFPDFYLDSAGLSNHHFPTGDKSKIQLFLTVAALLLLIAIINYTILSTANALYRQKEFGIRKSFGSDRKRLRLQTLSETMTMALIALPISIILTELLLPFANTFWDKELDFNIFKNWPILLIFLFLSIITGLSSGAYLSFYISKLNPTLILSDIGNKRSGLSIRKSLIVIQIFIFVVLSSFSVLVLKQMDYFQSKPLGYNPENLICYYLELSNPRNNQYTNATRIESFVKEINNYPYIDLASYFEIQIPPYGDNTGAQGVTTAENPNDLKIFLTMSGDHNVSRLMGLKLLKGSDLKENDFDKLLLTKTGVKYLGLEDPIGKTISAGGNYEIIGIVEDFHAQSFRKDIVPMLIRSSDISKSDLFPYLNFGIRYKPGSEFKVKEYVKHKFKEYFPNYAIDKVGFQKDRIKEIYQNEQKIAQTVIIGVAIVIFISTMGLFALSLYESERRIKEIAIRKINGANPINIVVLLSKEFTKWVLLAFVLAVPVSYFIMNKWLENFIYQTLISWWIFILIGIITVLITWGTISIQSLRAAMINPVDALRND